MTIKPGKLFMKNSYHGKPLIVLGSVIWDNIQPPLLTPEFKEHSEFLAPNRLLIKIEDEVFLFYYEHFKLHGIKLFIGPNT